MFSLDEFKKELKKTFKTINKSAAYALNLQIAINFVAGMTAGEKHKSSEPDEQEGLTTEQKEEIAVLVALFLGYLSAFNDAAQKQILSKVTEMIDSGSQEQEIKQYLDDIFTGKETIIIDNRGKERKEIYVDKDLKLSEVTKTIENTYSTTIGSYVALLGENAAHTSYERGRKSQNIIDNYLDWVFVGPADEITRPWHLAIIGEVFTYNTDQSEYAQHCLEESRCRHWAERYFNDSSKDKSPEHWQKIKDDAGLEWSETFKKWTIKT